MYVNKLSCPEKDETKYVTMNVLSHATHRTCFRFVEVVRLTEELQHRLYDFVDELGVGDTMAEFIQLYNRQRVAEELARSWALLRPWIEKEPQR